MNEYSYKYILMNTNPCNIVRNVIYLNIENSELT